MLLASLVFCVEIIGKMSAALTSVSFFQPLKTCINLN